MTYVDECLERARKATDGPWPNVYLNLHSDNIYPVQMVKPEDTIFIAHARTDVAELAKRLKGACEIIKAQHLLLGTLGHDIQDFDDAINDLERPLGEK